MAAAFAPPLVLLRALMVCAKDVQYFFFDAR